MKFIEIEGFQPESTGFIIKELCVLDERNPLQPLYYIFKEEFSFDSLTQNERYQVGYVTGHIHGLSWNEVVSIFCASCVERQIIQDFGCDVEFYTMGEQKVNILSQIFPRLTIYHVEKSFKDLPCLMPHITCLHRSHGEHCALRKCYRLMLSFQL